MEMRHGKDAITRKSTLGATHLSLGRLMKNHLTTFLALRRSRPMLSPKLIKTQTETQILCLAWLTVLVTTTRDRVRVSVRDKKKTVKIAALTLEALMT
jgi:hypothetical protein